MSIVDASYKLTRGHACIITENSPITGNQQYEVNVVGDGGAEVFWALEPKFVGIRGDP